MQRTFLRITQEALANVHRHAAASRVCVDGRIVADKVHLIISDDGRGLESKNDAIVGRGVRGMEDRTSQWRGRLRIRSGLKGTKVHAMWPVPH
jgi:signal transduction histidine kinase